MHGMRVTKLGRQRDRSFPRGRLVEFVRLIFVLMGAIAGYTIATEIQEGKASRILLGVVLGAATGFVIGGVFGRQTVSAVSAMEREFRRVPAAEVAAGTVGLVLGLVVAALATFPLFRLPPQAAWPAAAFIYVTLSYLGYRVGRAKNQELFGMLGLKLRAVGVAPGEVSVIDTSALIDGRVADLVNTGFISGSLLIHSGVLEELQRIADSSSSERRTRGRRGLDVVAELQRAPTVEVHLVEEAGAGDVDAALVRLARDRGASLVTVDTNLAKVAEALSVPVRQVHSLAAAFRVPFAPGDEVVVKLIKEGREHGQAVGYLEDGTMVVVEDAGDRVGDQLSVTVKNVIQTSTGRMVFALPAGARPPGSESS